MSDTVLLKSNINSFISKSETFISLQWWSIVLQTGAPGIIMIMVAGVGMEDQELLWMKLTGI